MNTIQHSQFTFGIENKHNQNRQNENEEHKKED